MAARALPLSLIAVGGLLLTAGAGASASAAGAPTDTRTSITVDCDLGEGSNDNQVILPGETLTVTLLNCDGWNVDDQDAGVVLRDTHGVQSNTWEVVGTPYVFTVEGGADIDMDPPGESDDDIDIDVFVADPASTPTGELNLTERLTMPVEIPAFAIDVPTEPAVSGASTVPGDTIEPAVDLGGFTECSMEDGYHPYQTLPISTSTSGDFTFRVIDVTPVDEDLQWGQPYLPSQDFFLAVYTSFDPENPEENLVSCNDDRGSFSGGITVVNGGVTYISDDQTPEFIASLEPGDYTLVLTTYRSTSSENWANGEFSPWSGVSDTTWDPQPMSALFELWGPAGSIELGGAGSDGGEELAETGQDGSTISTFAAAGFAVGALGIALMVARRRQAQA